MVRTLEEQAAFEKKVIGADIVELAPVDNMHAYNFTAARLVYDLMGIIQRSSSYT